MHELLFATARDCGRGLSRAWQGNAFQLAARPVKNARCLAFGALQAELDLMNTIERFLGLKSEARVKYLSGEYQVLSPGDYVLCAVTGKPIPLADLKYWNVDNQEAYVTAEASLQAYRARREGKTG